MSEIPKRTIARMQFALGILERHKRHVEAAITALRAVEETRRIAEIALESVTAIEAEEKERIAKERAKEEADVRARLAADGATDHPPLAPAPELTVPGPPPEPVVTEPKP